MCLLVSVSHGIKARSNGITVTFLDSQLCYMWTLVLDGDIIKLAQPTYLGISWVIYQYCQRSKLSEAQPFLYPSCMDVQSCLHVGPSSLSFFRPFSALFSAFPFPASSKSFTYIFFFFFIPVLNCCSLGAN